VSSIEPDGSSGQVDSSQEVACRLVVTRRQGAELLQLTEEVFNPVAGFVAFPVVGPWLFAVGLGRNHRRFPGLRQRLEYPLVGIVAFIGNHDLGLDHRQQHIGSVQIAGLSGRQQKAGRVTASIDRSMDLRAQSAFAAPDRLVLTLFF